MQSARTAPPAVPAAPSLSRQQTRAAAPSCAASPRPRRACRLHRRLSHPVAAAVASFGDEEPDFVKPPLVVFPRVKERDPYRLLGVSREATSQEVQDARNYLRKEHQMHVEGVEAIEMAFDRIINQKLQDRKRKGIKIERPKRKDDVEVRIGFVDRIRDRIVVPPTKLILQRAAVYAFIVVWSLYTSAASGPAFQVAVAYGLTAYYIHEKRGLKALFPAMGQALLGLFSGWIVGSILPVYVPVFPPSLGPETVAALFAYVTMFISAVFFK